MRPFQGQMKHGGAHIRGRRCVCPRLSSSGHSGRGDAQTVMHPSTLHPQSQLHQHKSTDDRQSLKAIAYSYIVVLTMYAWYGVIFQPGIPSRSPLQRPVFPETRMDNQAGWKCRLITGCAKQRYGCRRTRLRIRKIGDFLDGSTRPDKRSGASTNERISQVRHRVICHPLTHTEPASSPTRGYRRVSPAKAVHEKNGAACSNFGTHPPEISLAKQPMTATIGVHDVEVPSDRPLARRRSH